MLESAKSLAERVTGIGRPSKAELRALVRARKPHTFFFEGDGETPNNPRLPLTLYKSPLRLDTRFDPAAILEALFATHGWRDSWRDSMYDWNHWHTRTHEVLGIARGALKARFGGRDGRVIEVEAGDVIAIPAGTGHFRLRKSRDLLVVGAYPENAGAYDEQTPEDDAYDESLAHVALVKPPRTDPVYGREGPLRDLWRRRS